MTKLTIDSRKASFVVGWDQQLPHILLYYFFYLLQRHPQTRQQQDTRGMRRRPLSKKWATFGPFVEQKCSRTKEDPLWAARPATLIFLCWRARPQICKKTLQTKDGLHLQRR